MFGCDGISDHASWIEVFHYGDTKLSCSYTVMQTLIHCKLFRLIDVNSISHPKFSGELGEIPEALCS